MNVMFEIMSTRDDFRGMERSLCIDDIPRKRNFKEVLQVYLEYENYMAPIYGMPHTFDNIKKIEEYCVKLLRYDVPCELVVYANKKITDLFSYEIEFLGIDFEVDSIEGILQAECKELSFLLNSNCLCETEEDVRKVLDYLKIRYDELELFFIYKVILK